MIRIKKLWWHYIGKSIFTMQLDVIIERTDYSCPKLHLIFVDIPIAVIWQIVHMYHLDLKRNHLWDQVLCC